MVKDYAIFAMVITGSNFQAAGASYGVSASRASQCFYKIERRIRYKQPLPGGYLVITHSKRYDVQDHRRDRDYWLDILYRHIYAD